jgi:hypothetical protein
MKSITVATMLLLTFNGISGAQTASDTQPIAANPSDTPPVTDSLKDLDALTLSCPRAALNAAAREAAKVHARGTYQFSYFNIINESHHARYEVHFRSNYEGETELKYCVVLYCQQGWDPAQADAAVTLMSVPRSSATVASPMANCPETDRMGAQCGGAAWPLANRCAKRSSCL